MTTTTDKLAQALRALCTEVERVGLNRGGIGNGARLAADASRALAEYDALAQHDGETLESFVAQIARLKTDDEMDGDMSGDDAVSTLSDLIEEARGFAAYDAQRNASAAPAGAHTPEPWTVEATATVSAEPQGKRNYREPVAYCVGTMNSDANARRIVACVNACAGIPTERVETIASETRGALRSGLLVHTIAETATACAPAGPTIAEVAGIADPERAVRLLRDLSRVLDNYGEDDGVSGADALDALTDLRDRARAVLGGAA